MLPKNKQHLTRRIHQLTDLAEDQINGYENKKSGWWCEAYNKNSFYINLRNRCIDIFVNDNIDFFGNDNLERGEYSKAIDILIRFLNENFMDETYDLFIRKCENFRDKLTESKFNSQIPNEVKRRIDEDDLKKIDEIFKRKHKNLVYIYATDSFDSYFEDVILDSIREFLFTYKSSEWRTDPELATEQYKGITPYLKNKFYKIANNYYKKNK